jgi:hypothetical protein
VRTILTVIGAAAAVLLALASCSTGTVQNAAATSSTSSTPTRSADSGTHAVTYLYSVPGVDAPYTYVADSGSVTDARTGAVALSKTVRLAEGKIAMVAGGAAADVVSSHCSIALDGRTVAENTSVDPKTPAMCSYIVH